MTTPGRVRRLVFWLLLTGTIGLALGWFLPADWKRSFDYLYALLIPALVAMVCARAMTAETEQPRWVMPAYLALALVHVANRPHVPALTVLSIGAAAVASLAALGNRRTTAIVSAVVACIAISASLILALRTS